jgi:CheY-like chemotaxis protein
VTDLDPALGPVLADRGQMHQVLMNLAVNARDAMPDGGTIRIATANVVGGDVDAASDAQPGPFVSLAVSDTGIGMSAETLQKIFEPFFTTKPLGIGTGLGLATVYGIVQQSDGIVRVASRPGEGTTFRIYLPRIEDAEGVAVVAAPTQEGLLGTETILVVEDQEEVRRLAVGILRRHGYRVLEGANGFDALSAAEGFAGAIDLLVTDVIMPGMTGRELAQRMVRVRPGLKVLYMSGYSDDLLAKDGLTSGSLSYLPKPFAPAELARKVREVLGGSRPKGRILVIDDDASVREVLAGILGAAGYEVETAADGDAGVQALEANPIRLLITDLVMPHLEGLEVLKLVRERFPHIPVIAVSGALDGEFLKAATALGAGAALLKPIAADRLIPEVKRLIG